MVGVFSLLLALQFPALAAVLTPATPREGEAVRAAVVEEMSRGGRTAFVASENSLVPPATCDFALLANGVIPLDGAAALRTASELRLAESAAALPGPFARRLRAEAERWPGAGSYSVYIGLPRGDEALRWTATTFSARIAALLARAPVDRVVALADPEDASFPVSVEFLKQALAPLGFAPDATRRPAPGAVLLSFRKTDALRPIAGASPAP
jgi:hypothetical protein